MAQIKKRKKKSSNALKKYWKILRIIRFEYAKKKIKVTINELRKDASVVYKELKELPINKIGRERVINASSDKVQKQKKKKKEQPYIHPDLLTYAEYYTAAVNYPNWIESSSLDAKFISSISPDGYDEFNGGDVVDYATYFKNFTAHCNNLELVGGSDDVDLPCTIVIPEYIEQDNDWVFRIISGRLVNNENGEKEIEEDDFGFDPKEPLQIVDFSKRQRTEKEQISEKESESSENIKLAQIESNERIKIAQLKAQIESDERVKLAKIQSEEREKDKNRNQLKELLGSGIITFEQYLKGLKEI